MLAKRFKLLGAHSLAIFACLTMVIPFYLVVVNSFKSKADASSMSVALPATLHAENFSTVISAGKLVTSFLNSVLYASGSTIIGTLFAAMAAFVLSRNRSRFNRFLYFFIIMGIALPANYFTLTKVMQITTLINTRSGIILLLAAGQIPFGVFLIYGFLDTIPRELDEAAIMDGCGPLQLFFQIILPMLTPVLVTDAVLSFLGAWSNFIMPLYYLKQYCQMANDFVSLQLLRTVPGKLESGFGRYFIDSSACNFGISVCPALHSFGNYYRSRQGLSDGIKLRETGKFHPSTKRPPD